MKKFSLEVPLTGYFWCEVVAESVDDAYNKACEMFSELENIDKSRGNYELIELNPIMKMHDGNVYHGSSVDELTVLSEEEVSEERDEDKGADPGGEQ